MGIQITNWVSVDKFEHTGIARKAAEKHKATEEKQLFVKRIGECRSEIFCRVKIGYKLKPGESFHNGHI